VATPCAPGDPDGADIVCCGRPFPGHAVRIVGEDGRDVAEREVGEVLVRGPSVMRGYLDPHRAAEALRDGWLWTGDLGYQVDGELYVCGRRTDTIIAHGRNYFPQDLEWAAAQVPGVRPGRVAAFAAVAPGAPDRVVVVVEGRGDVTAGALERAVRARLLEATGLAVDEVVVAPPGTVPRTTSGKVKRARLRAQYESGAPLAPRRAEPFAVARQLVRSQLGYARAFARQIGQRPGRGPGQESW
jgi:fatty-acyl-CoA synthase